MSKQKGFDRYAEVAKYYDYDPRPIYLEDISFYEHCAETAGCTDILELGCGTGRVALPLARRGYHVTAIDNSPSMLEVLKEKRAVLKNISGTLEVIEGDMTDFSLDKEFGLIIMPYHAFQSLTSLKEVRGCLDCVKRHLTEGGMFIVDVFRPRLMLDENCIYPERVQWTAFDHYNEHKLTKFDEVFRIDSHNQILYCRQRYAVEGNDIDSVNAVIFLEIKYYYEDQIRSLLEKHGFKTEAGYGWYEREPITDGREQIFICKVK